MIVARLDHLVLATRELEETVRWAGDALGVQPVFGGRHQGLGTRNHLLSFGSGRYLEVVGPDPDQPEPASPRRYGLDSLDRPRLVAWAARSSQLEEDAEKAARLGQDLGAIREMSRTTPEGETLTWRLTTQSGAGVAVIPFLIDWGDSRHPSTTAPSGASLTDFRAEHPDPDRMRRVLDALGLELDVRAGPEARLFAELSGPAGVLRLS